MTLQGVVKDFKLSNNEYTIVKRKDIKIPIRNIRILK